MISARLTLGSSQGTAPAHLGCRTPSPLVSEEEKESMVSVKAMSWVFSQDIRPSQVKFVLLALADHADDEGMAFPSLKHLCSKTSQDRKTVISALDDLESMGLIRDTNDRVGVTKQVKVYQIVGLPSSTYHYVYKLINIKTQEFYIGVRSCFCAPEDDEYMGSGMWPSLMKKEGTKLTKEIISKWPSRPSAEGEEERLIKENYQQDRCRNRSVRGLKQYRWRHKTVPQTDGNSSVDGTRNHNITFINRKETSGVKRCKCGALATNKNGQCGVCYTKATILNH